MFKKSLLLMLLMALFMPYAAQAQETLTVCDGTTTNGKIPVNGLYVDTQGTTSEFIIPAETTGMSDMGDGTISKVTFYINQIPGTWGSPTIQLYIGEVEGTTLSAINGPSSFTIVNTSVWSNQSSTIEVEFDAPYTYNGGNLLIGTYVQTKSSTYKTTNFDGAEAASGASRYNNGSGSGTAAAFLPKTTFTYTPNPYKKPVNLDYANIDPTSTEVTWEAPITSETIAGYLYSFKKTSDTDWPTLDEFTTDDHIVLDALEAGTSYDFRVKTDYTSEQSGYATISFTTLEACMTPENLQITDVFAHSAKLNWTEGYGNGEWKLGYKTTADADFTYVDVVAADLPYTLGGLTAETAYNVKVYPLCDETKSVTGSFTTTVACPTPTALAVTLTPGDGTVATFNWTENGLAAEWELCLDGDETNLIPMGTNPFTYDQFTPEQTYTAKVRAVCGGADGESEWSSTITFTPTDAYSLTVNDGTGTNEYVPFYGYYADSDADGLFIIPSTTLTALQWGTINKLTFYVSSPASNAFTNSSGTETEYAVYMMETAQTTFENATISFDGMTLVKNPYHITINDSMLEITLDNPFYYKGGNLMIGFDETTNGGYVHTNWYGISATGASIGGYGTSYSQKNFLPKTTFTYTPGLPPTCDIPTDLAVVGTPEAHKVVLQWTENGTATEWQLCLNGDETNPINVTENPYTLEGIDSDTDFSVKVRAYCSDTDQSYWSNEVTFHTAVACEKPTNLVITYTGGDTAEVSWDSESTITDFNIDVNGVVKAITGNTYSLDGLLYATTYTVKVQSDCGGGEVSAWVSDSFTTDMCAPADMCEITFQLTDAWGDGWNGAYIEVIDVLTSTILGQMANENLNGTQGSGENELNTKTLAVCDGREIQFVWHTGSYDSEASYVVKDVNGEEIFSGNGAMSAPVNFTVSCAPVTCEKPTGLVANPVGNTVVVSWTSAATAWQLCLDDDEVNLIDVTENPYTIENLSLSTDYTVRVRANCGVDGYSNWTSNVNFTTDECAIDDACQLSYELKVNNGYEQYGWYGSFLEVYDNANNLLAEWTVEANQGTATGIFGVCDGKELVFQWYSASASNDEVLIGSIKVYDAGGNLIIDNNGALTSDVDYTVNCNPCPAVTNVEATNIAAKTATITWDGSHERYDLRYKPDYTYHFEDGLGAWTTIDADGDGFNWLWSETIGINGYQGSKCLYSQSYDNNGNQVLYPDNYLVSPKVQLGGSISFYACSQDGGFLEHFGVAVSTSGNTSASDFTTIQDWTCASAKAQSPWTLYTADLSAYAGEEGYVAIRHYESSDKFYLDIDDITILEPGQTLPDWTTVENITEKTYDLTGLTPETPYAVQVRGYCAGETEPTLWTSILNFNTVSGNVFTSAGDWNMAGNWLSGEVPAPGSSVVIAADVVVPNNYVADAGRITFENAATITVEDGGQLKTTYGGANATMLKNIDPRDATSGWNFIASPVMGDLAPDAVGMVNSDYDLYSFNEEANAGQEWVNYKAHMGSFGITNGQGYLYATAEDNVELAFTGELNPTNLDKKYSLETLGTGEFKGFFLMGNPFSCNAYLADNSLEFYVMNDTKDDITTATNRTIAPMQGFFVYVDNTMNLNITTTQPAKSNKALNMSISKGGAVVDNAIVRFGEGEGLAKFQLNPNHTKLYIPQDNKDYAVVYADNQGEMPVCFKAETNGNYTLNFNTDNVEFGYLHLIDNMTGNDVDLLATPSYNFEARYTDYASRFKLVFATGNVDESFAFIGNGEIILNGINANTTVQMFDVTGRMISSTNGANRIAIDNMAAGVYMIRLINGDNVKTQKIIVK